MKFKELLDAVDSRHNWISFACDWSVQDDGNVAIKPYVNITLDTEVDVHYQWFWHCNLDVNTTEIYNAIATHDYETFTKWFDAFKERLPVEYLPINAEIRVDGEYIGDICVAFSEQTFKLITSQDHECG